MELSYLGDVTRSNTDGSSGPNVDEMGDPERDHRAWTTHAVRDDEPVTRAVVRAMSAETESDSMDLPPLYSVLDPDALNALFATPSGSSSRSDCAVSFDYHGREVRVTSPGTVQISPAR